MIKLPRIPDNIQKKEFRKLMETPGTKFNIEGHSHPHLSGVLTVFEVGNGYITSDHRAMNVGYMGNTKMDLYSFAMMSNKTTATIKFATVTIISSPRPIPADMEVKNVTIIK